MWERAAGHTFAGASEALGTALTTAAPAVALQGWLTGCTGRGMERSAGRAGDQPPVPGLKREGGRRQAGREQARSDQAPDTHEGMWEKRETKTRDPGTSTWRAGKRDLLGGMLEGERSEGTWLLFKETMQTTHITSHPSRKRSRNQLGCAGSSSLTSGSRQTVTEKWELGQMTKEGYKSGGTSERPPHKLKWK